MNPIMKTNRFGSALVIVLWLVMLMTMVAAVTAQMTLLDSRVSQLSVERIRCRWAARAGFETAMALLLADERNTDTLLDIWAENKDLLSQVPLEDCQFTVQVTDESGKLNLNTVTAEQLSILPDMTEEILDSLLDWIDGDEEIRPGGAESGYYLTLPNGYYCRNGEVKTIREILRVKGVEERFVYGPREEPAWSENEGWIHYLTCVSAQANTDVEGNPRTNVNRGGQRQLMDALSLSRENAQWIVENRQFTTLAELTEEKNNSGSSSGASASGTQSASSSSGTSSGTRTSSQNSGSTSQTRTSSSGSQQQQQQQQQDDTKPLEWNTLLQKADQITTANESFVPGRINVNTAGLLVLEALFEGNRELAENLIAYREGLEGGIESFDELTRVQGMSEQVLKKVIDQIGLCSSVFRIQSTAKSDATEQTAAVEAIVNRDEPEKKVLYWREG